MLGVGGNVGYGGCEPRVEGIVQGTKKVLYNIKKVKKYGRGEGEGQYLNQNTLYVLKKKKKKGKKKLTEQGLEPTTSGFEIH